MKIDSACFLNKTPDKVGNLIVSTNVEWRLGPALLLRILTRAWVSHKLVKPSSIVYILNSIILNQGKIWDF